MAVEYPNYGASLEAYPWETGRLRHVTELVAEKSEWGKRKHGKGSGVGIAAHRSFLTYVATVVEVEVNDQGEVRIPRVDTALDAGLVVNWKQLAPSSRAPRYSVPALRERARLPPPRV